MFISNSLKGSDQLISFRRQSASRSSKLTEDDTTSLKLALKKLL